MNGSIRRRSKGSWELNIDIGRDAKGKRLRRFLNVKGKKADAERKLREIIDSMERGLPARPEKLTVGEWLTSWLGTHGKQHFRQKTLERYSGLIERHIVPSIGHLKLTKLAPVDIRNLEADLLNAGMAPAGVELVHTVISGALKAALRLDLVWRNVAQAVSAPRRPHHELQIPELGNIRRVLDRARDDRHELYAAVHLVAYGGLRRGECLGLSWDNVDLDGGTVSIVRSLVRSQELGLIFTSPKTDRSRRRIDIDSETVEVLRATTFASSSNA